MISRVTTDLVTTPNLRNEVEPTGGIDVKYGVTRSLTANLSYNTDFAESEADDAQVNLTRFNQFFPEKREFFLEAQGAFQFGVGGSSVSNSQAPRIFFSRRIGLNAGSVIPVIGGGRLAGRAGPWTLGALSMETDSDSRSDAPKTNFTVLRVRHDVLRRSNVGALFTRRSVSTVAPGANDVVGLDGNFVFYQNVYLSGYLARSMTKGRRGEDVSYRTQFNYTHDRYGLELDRNVVERNFNPEVGFMPRTNFRRNFALVRFSPSHQEQSDRAQVLRLNRALITSPTTTADYQRAFRPRPSQSICTTATASLSMSCAITSSSPCPSRSAQRCAFRSAATRSATWSRPIKAGRSDPSAAR